MQGGEGPSPRVRGSRMAASSGSHRAGSIPACGGEAQDEPLDASLAKGPSPRVRGSLLGDHEDEPEQGSIPACAGKPSAHDAPAAASGSIPACAGSPGGNGNLERKRGSIPACAGSRGRVAEVDVVVGSIPACAGKPRVRRRSRRARRVHPRVCGEARMSAATMALLPGPSPRVRGSPIWSTLNKTGPGSIPACAGEARPPPLLPGWSRVHPRVCGGSSASR